MQTRFVSSRLLVAVLLASGGAIVAPLLGSGSGSALLAQEATSTPEVATTPEASSTPTATPDATATPTPTPSRTPKPSATPETSPTMPPASAAPAEPTASPASGCLDFATQADAQAFFEANGGPGSDPQGLDPERDGMACENIQAKVEHASAGSQESLSAPAPNVPPLTRTGPRTAPRNTFELVSRLEHLTEFGVPIEQVLVGGMGRFPVAGRANYFDDWLNPRHTPTFHLHQGLDIFAAFGTPIRSPDAGTVLRFSDNPSGGGIGVTITGADGTNYYFGHMRERAQGLAVSQAVQVGTVIGYVGDTGNARGGLPHLHLETRRDGVPFPPKPEVDRWLDEAIEGAAGWVQTRQAEIVAARGPAPAPTVTPPPAPAVVAAPATPEALPIRPTGLTTGAYGLAGLLLALASLLGASIVHRRKRRPSRSKPSWDEYSLIGA